MSAPPFEIEFTITIDDFVAYLRLLQHTLNVVGVMLGLAVLVVGGLIALLAQDLFTGLWTLLIGLLFVVLAGTEFLDRFRVQRNARSLIGTVAKLKFDEEGITADTASGSGNVPWSAVTQLKQNDRVIVIRRDRIPVAWIPKRAFETTEESATLTAYIDAQIAAARTTSR